MGLFEATVKALNQLDEFYPNRSDELNDGLLGWLRLLWQYHNERDPDRKLHLRERIELTRKARREDRRTWHKNKMLYRRGLIVPGPEDNIALQQDDMTLEGMCKGTQRTDREFEPCYTLSSKRLDETERRITLANDEAKMALVRRIDDILRRHRDPESDTELSRLLEEKTIRNELLKSQSLVTDIYRCLMEKEENKSRRLSELVKRSDENRRTRLQIIDDVTEHKRRQLRLKELKQRYLAPGCEEKYSMPNEPYETAV